MDKLKKFLKISFIVIGTALILAAFTLSDLTIGDRVIYGLLGAIAIVLAIFSAIRYAIVAAFSYLMAGTGLFSIIGPDGTPDFSYLISAGVFLAVGIIFTRKMVRKFQSNSENRTSSPRFHPAMPGDIVINSTSNLQGFLATHTLVDTIFTKVVGVTYKNDDGSPRQRILASCHIGDEIALRPFTYRGAPAYAVWSPHGQIGNLSADLARDIDANFGDCIVQCTIATITGGTDGLYYGCNLIIKIYKENEYAKPPWRSTAWQATASTHKPSDEQVRNTYKLPDEQATNTYILPDEQAANAPPESFIAEAQWYAARGGADLKDDE